MNLTLARIATISFFALAAGACDGGDAVAEGDIEKAIKEPGKIVVELKEFVPIPEHGNCAVHYAIHNNAEKRIQKMNVGIGLVKDGKLIEDAETGGDGYIAAGTVLSQSSRGFPLRLIFDDLDCAVAKQAKVIFAFPTCVAIRDENKVDDFEPCADKISVVTRLGEQGYKIATFVKDEEELNKLLSK